MKAVHTRVLVLLHQGTYRHNHTDTVARARPRQTAHVVHTASYDMSANNPTAAVCSVFDSRRSMTGLASRELPVRGCSTIRIRAHANYLTVGGRPCGDVRCIFAVVSGRRLWLRLLLDKRYYDSNVRDSITQPRSRMSIEHVVDGQSKRTMLHSLNQRVGPSTRKSL